MGLVIASRNWGHWGNSSSLLTYIPGMKHNGSSLLIVALIALALSACGGGGENPIPPDQLALFAEAVDVELVVRARGNVMEYLDTRIEAPAGARVRLVMDNTETSSPAMVHNVVVIQSESAVERVALAAQSASGNIPDDVAILVHTPQAQPGTKTGVIFTMPAAGDYPYICTFPGHFQAMRGTMVSTGS